MATPTTRSGLRGLVLSATELKRLTGWSSSVVRDYLSILENFIHVSTVLDAERDKLLEETATAFLDGTIPYVGGGFLLEDNANLKWNNLLNQLEISKLAVAGDASVGGDLGVTGDVSIGEEITAVKSINFSSTPTGTPVEREFQWDTDASTMGFGLPGGVVGQMFQELFFDAKNGTLATVPDGTPVMFAAPVGASGKVEFQLAIADGSIPSEYIMGITTQEIAAGAFGKVTWFGKVRGIDTTGTPYGEVWANGDLIYVGTTAGKLTNLEPNAPAQRILVAAVTTLHANNGVLMLRPTWNSKLTDLDDVNGTPLATTGQFPVWDNANSYFDFNFNINNYLPLAGGTMTGDIIFNDNVSAIFGTGSDSSIYFDGSNLNIKSDDVAASDILITTGANKTIELQNTVWDDQPPSAVSVGFGASAPSFTVYNGTLRAYEFVGIANLKAIHAEFQFSHRYKEGTDINFHIHLYVPTDTTGGGDIKFYCDYVWENKFAAPGTPATISGTLTRTNGQTADGNIILSFGTITGTGKTLSSILSTRIYRDPNDVADTWAQSVWLKSADAHFEMDTIGSRQMTTK